MNEQRLNIYPHREKTFDRELKNLEIAKLSQSNKELIIKFHNYMFSKGSGILRVAKLSSQLRRVCAKLKKDLDSLTKSDLIDLIAIYNKDTRYSEATKADYRRTIKQFYIWFKEEDTKFDSQVEGIRNETKKFYHFVEKEISSSYKKYQADPSTIITDEDCLSVIDKGCKTSREKAFISMLHESGCRAGEFLNIKLCDINIRENHLDITVDGKTGKRTIFLIKSMPSLLRYLEVHPYKDNVGSYLWLSEANANRNDPILHKGAQKLINRCFERAGNKKKHNFHWFRHSRASILAPKITTPMLCQYMGWNLDTKQVKTYCHLSIKQLEDVVLAINGVKSIDEEIKKPVKCVCGALNTPNERYCFKCYKPLNVETAIQDRELVNSEINKTVQFMMEMAKNPEMMKAFEEFKSSRSK